MARMIANFLGTVAGWRWDETMRELRVGEGKAAEGRRTPRRYRARRARAVIRLLSVSTGGFNSNHGWTGKCHLMLVREVSSDLGQSGIVL
jgi:hypothetical protein